MSDDHHFIEAGLNQELAPQEACQWAFEAMTERNWTQAVQRWAIFRVVYPEYAPVWIQAAVACRELQRYDEAEKLLAEARQRFPNHPGGWLHGATVAAARKNDEQAWRLLEEGRARFPNEPQLWLRSAEMAFEEGRIGDAEEYNRHLRDAFSNQPGGYIQHADFAMRVEDWNEASRRWAIVRERFPDRPAGYHRGADALDQLGEKAEAKRLRLAQRYGGLDLNERSESRSPNDRMVTLTQRSLWGFAELVWVKAWFNLKSEAAKNQLNYLWWVIEPLMFMVVYYVVFTILLSRGGDNYVAYLLSGVMPFQWFAKTTQSASSSIMQGHALMRSVRVSPLFFPLVSLFQNTGKQIPVFGLLAILITITGHPPTIYWLGLVPVILLQLFFLGVLGCMLAVTIPFARDLANLVPVGINFTLFASGVFYTLDTIPDRWLSLFLANPMANLLYQYRLVLVENSWPDWSMLGGLLALCVAGSMLLWWGYGKLEAVLPRVVVE